MAKATLSELRIEALGCVACDLHRTRTKVVFGSGSERASLMIVGEAPGRDEDLSGLPFVGRSGRLVTTLLEEEFGRSRDWCFISNVVKCRPPDNRNPTRVEVLTCQHYLKGQIELVAPQIIMPLGNFATRSLLSTNEGITTLRGKVVDRGRYLVIPSFHPAAALRGGQKVMGLLREDFRYAAELLRKITEQ